MDEAQLERAAGHYSRAAGQEVEAHDVLEQRTLAAGLRAQHCDPGQRDLLIEPVVAHLVDDVDQLPDVLEEVRLQELFVRHFVLIYQLYNLYSSAESGRSGRGSQTNAASIGEAGRGGMRAGQGRDGLSCET